MRSQASGALRLFRRGAVTVGGSLAGILTGRHVGLVISLLVHTGHATSRSIRTALECRIPLQGDLTGASDGVLPADRLCRRAIVPVVPGKDVPVEVRLLRSRSLQRKTTRCRPHLLFADVLLRVSLDGVNPSVADPITELLLLPPEDVFRQICTRPWEVEGLPQDPLLAAFLASCIHAHLLLGVKGQGHLHETPVQEGHPRLHAPCHHCLVCSEAVVEVELLHLPHILLVELFGIWRLVEVEVSSEDLVCTFSAEHHLHASGPDSPRHQVHGCCRSDCRHIEGLQRVDDIGQGIQALLWREGVLVVHSSQVLGYLPRCCEVGAGLESDAEGVELRPVGRFMPMATLAVPRHDRCH
mmetsp:Transcript_51059/g.110805  ORF Transcript_51059/g.110805 Transcript_51059/m.110805 type:complete len:355 (+) Transcript_51059:166-1230(+)